MRSGHKIKFIVLIFCIAIVLTILPLPNWYQRIKPEWMLLFVLYFSLLEPNRISIGMSWLSGIVIDILQNNVLGEHALIFTLVAYFLVKFNARINFFPFWNKFLIMLCLIVTDCLLRLWIERLTGNRISSIWYFLSALTTILLWPWVFNILQVRQRRH